MSFAPPKSDKDILSWLARFSNWINREFAARPRPGTAVAGVLLLSPDGDVYRVTVDNVGTLTTELVDA